MKLSIKITSLFCLILALSACKKDDDNIQLDAGAINVTNAVIGGGTLTFSTTNSIVSSANTIAGNAYTFMPLTSGQTPVNLSVPAVAATATTPAVPAVVYYNQTLAVDNTTNYSLFLTGTSPSTVESVLIKENYTRNYADSVCGVRFINLSPGSNPISVNIKGSANGSEVTSLAYKAYGDFKQYPAKSANKIILFEIRDAATGTLLYPTNGNGFSLPVPYFHNVTLAYRGTGSAVGIIVVKDF